MKEKLKFALGQLNTISLLFQCGGASLWRPGMERIVPPKAILVVQGGQLGDMVCTTPLFRAIKEKFPTVRLVVMGNALNKDVLAGNPHIDEYIVYNTYTSTVGSLRQLLRTHHIEYACITSPDFTMTAALYLTGIHHIVALFVD